jgi:hypothetical protein
MAATWVELLLGRRKSVTARGSRFQLDRLSGDRRRRGLYHGPTRLPQKPDSQNASRPGRHQIGMVGEIISESWARSNRYTRARSSESAPRRAGAGRRPLLRRDSVCQIVGQAEPISTFAKLLGCASSERQLFRPAATSSPLSGQLSVRSRRLDCRLTTSRHQSSPLVSSVHQRFCLRRQRHRHDIAHVRQLSQE